MSNQTVPHVYKAICDVTEEMAKVGISKNRKNQQQGYAFRGVDDLYNTLAPLLPKASLCIIPRMVAREVQEKTTAKGGVMVYTTVCAEFDFVSALDGSKHTVATYGEAMDSGDKSTNKAMSAAYKYACFQTFCIPTEGDNDSENATHEIVVTDHKEQAQSLLETLVKLSGCKKEDLTNMLKAKYPNIKNAAEWIKPLQDTINKFEEDPGFKIA